MYNIEETFHECVIVVFKASNHIHDHLSEVMSDTEKVSFIANVKENFSEAEYYKTLSEYYKDSYIDTVGGKLSQWGNAEHLRSK